MKIHAALLRRPQSPMEVVELDLAPPGPDEVLVKIAAAGICHSDWHVAVGQTEHPLPVVLGHEGAGTVAELGPGVDDLAVGDGVLLNWAPFCGQCFYCRRDRPCLCEAYVGPIWAGTLMDGTTRLAHHGEPVHHFSGLSCFAEYAVVPRACCVPMTTSLPWEIAALVGCAVTTGLGSVLNTVDVPSGSSVAVFGTGGVGLCIVMGAQLAGAEPIIAVDRTLEKARLAQPLGATHFLAAEDDVLEQIRELTSGRGADFVFEAVGAPAVQQQCLAAARPGGTIVLVGLAPTGSDTNLPGAVITRQEKTIVGSYYGTCQPTRDFGRVAELYQQGRLPLDQLISARYRLDQINEAYQAMLTGPTARGVIVFD